MNPVKLEIYRTSNFSDATTVFQVAVQSFKGVNPVRFAGRSMRSAASSADLEGFVYISGTWHPVRSFGKIPRLAGNHNDTFLHFARCRHVFGMGCQTPDSG